MKKTKHHIILFFLTILLVFGITPQSSPVFSQMDNSRTVDPIDPNDGGILNSGSGGTSINPPPPVDPLDPSLDPPTDPGGPVDPPDDFVPLDGGVVLLLGVGLLCGFYVTRKKILLQ